MENLNLTKKETKIINNVKKNKELLKNINNTFYGVSEDDKIKTFIYNVKRYLKAIKEGRIINSIGSVSKSGMSRTIKFLECSKGANGYNYLNFYSLFNVLGYKKAGNGYFRINGCGMDMIFHTNYTNINNFKTLGFISDKQCRVLAQKTPETI